MIEVALIGGQAFSVRVRQHALVVDQPVSGGGEDSGPSPTELLVASLASCVAYYAATFLRRHAPLPELTVRCDYAMAAERPSRVARVALDVDVPGPLRADVRDALLRAVDKCTVHNTLRMPPEVTISVREPIAAPAS